MPYRTNHTKLMHAYQKLLLSLAAIIQGPQIQTAGASELNEGNPLKGSKPNIIFILTDDQGYGDLSVHGNPILKTPVMDKFHDDSVRFTDFCVSPTCSPTRCALMTGRHEWRSGVNHTTKSRCSMDVKAITVAQVLKKAGYKTGIFGKWHLGTEAPYRPENRGFDVALTAGRTNHKLFDPPMHLNGELKTYKGFRTDILFTKAKAFIEKNKDERFFCYIPTYSPHTPLGVPKKYSAPYKNVPHKNFLGMVANIDENIGLLLKHVDDLKLTEKTLIILMNDNGGTNGVDVWNAGMRGRKGHTAYGGFRAFSFWRWPKTIKPGVRDHLTAHLDLLPTLADIAGAELAPEHRKSLEGYSLAPLLASENAPWNEERMLFIHKGRWKFHGTGYLHKFSHCAVRYKKMMLYRHNPCRDPNCSNCKKEYDRAAGSNYMYTTNIDHYRLTDDEQWMLFDLEKDLFEENDLFRAKPEIASKMTKSYDDWWDGILPSLPRKAAKKK